MNIRKNRSHLSGATNIDFRSVDSLPKSVTSHSLTHLEYLSSPKKNFDQLLRSKYAKKNSPAPNPFSETYSFYKDKGKPAHEIIKLSNNREKQLEKTGRNPFTGESNVYCDDRVYSNYKFKKLIDKKEDLNANTIQETQLAGIGSLHHETLEGKVNLEKIKEIRRILRRKYGARGNFQKIFNQWDNESKGAVSVQNVHEMLKRFGINVNLDESRVLVASADHDRTNDLNLDEFLELIFTDNEALNVDLKHIPVLSDGESTHINDQMRNHLEEMALQRHREQMSHILKNKMGQIARVCLDTDYLKSGMIDSKSLHHHLRQLGFSEKLLPDSDIDYLFEKFKAKKDPNGFNYPAFLRELKDFDYKSSNLRFEKVQAFIQKPKEVKGLSDVQKRLTMYDLSESEDPTILDNQRINVSKLENQRLRAKKVFRELFKRYPRKEDFETYLSDFGSRTEEETLKKEGLFTKDLLKEFIMGFFKENPSERITKQEIEGFLTNFTYNKHDETLKDEIPRLIYEEEDKDYYKRLGYRTCGPLPSIKNRLCSSLQISKSLESLGDENPQELEVVKLKHHHRTTENKKLRSVLRKVEDRFFSGSNTALKVFRTFDIDNDGFVSQDNLVSKIKETNLLTEEEIPLFLNYMDPENKGVLTFPEFSSKVRPIALQTDDMGRQTVIPNIAPDKEQTEYLKTSLPFIKSAVFDNKLALTPNQRDPLIGATRYGSSPVPPNTFLNFQANSNSNPMFVTPKERFVTGFSATLDFQKEEKVMKESRYNAKLASIRSFDENLRKRIEDEASKRKTKDTNQLKMKGLAQWSYEHRNHLKNDWN